tara:strand:+ start:91848 stop:92066 length:219 start_codon:yes stop_codon:yes gene_type:complete
LINDKFIASHCGDPYKFPPNMFVMRNVAHKKAQVNLAQGLPAVIPQGSALKMLQTKKRSSKLGVFSFCNIYS